MIGIQRHKKGRGGSLVIAGGIAVGVMLFGMTAQYWGSGRSRVNEVLEPNMSALLATGAIELVRVELPDSPQSARVVAYTVDGHESLALITWSLEENRFSVSSNVNYGDLHMIAPSSTNSLSIESLGLGAPVVVLARGPMNASTELVSVFARNGDALAPVRLNDAEGKSVPAQFEVGASTERSSDVMFQDVDGDGDKDAVVITANVQEGVMINELRTVNVWNDGAFFHDQELSRIMSMRSALFPEPEAVPLQ